MRQMLESAVLAMEYVRFPVDVCAYLGPMGEKTMVKTTPKMISQTWNGAKTNKMSLITLSLTFVRTIAMYVMETKNNTYNPEAPQNAWCAYVKF